MTENQTLKLIDSISCLDRNQSMMFKDASKLTLLDSNMKEAENDESSFGSSDEYKEQSGRKYERDAVDKINYYVSTLKKKIG